MDVLALRDNARYQLQQIKDVETGIEYLNKVRAIEVWAKAEKKDAELQNMIAEQVPCFQVPEIQGQTGELTDELGNHITFEIICK